MFQVPVVPAVISSYKSFYNKATNVFKPGRWTIGQGMYITDQNMYQVRGFDNCRHNILMFPAIPKKCAHEIYVAMTEIFIAMTRTRFGPMKWDVRSNHTVLSASQFNGDLLGWLKYHTNGGTTVDDWLMFPLSVLLGVLRDIRDTRGY